MSSAKWRLFRLGLNELKAVCHSYNSMRMVIYGYQYHIALYSQSLSWWCDQTETFSVLLALCAGNSLVTSEFPSQRQVAWSFDVFLDLHLNKRLSKQLWGWWFETSLQSLWHHCYDSHGSILQTITALKWKYDVDDIFVSGCTGCCHFNNFQCSQRQKFH